MVAYLKQSTAVTLVLGPFLDETDGKTAETALTISQADVRLSKNAAAFAQANEATAATHMENGYYSKPLNTTDTDTIGHLLVAIHESGALPVWQEYHVLAANVYDSLFGAATDKLDVNVEEWNTTAVPAEHTAGYPIVTIKDGTGTGEINTNAGAVALVDLVTTLTTYTGNTPQTGDSFARLGAPVGASISADVAGVQSDTNDIQGRLPAALTAGGNMKGDMLALDGSTGAATDLKTSALTIVRASAITGTLSTTQMTTDLTEATNDHYNGRRLIWTSGVLVDQATAITDYDGATKLLTYTAVTEAPSNGDGFIIV